MISDHFWFSLPFLFVFLFHSSILNHLGLKMSSLRGGRRTLVQTLAAKMERDQELDEFNKNIWYSVNLDKMDSSLRSKFVQLDADSDTETFIEQSVLQSDFLLTQLWYNVAKSFLSWFYCQTDINGMLSRGSMFVFSKAQFVKLTNFTGETFESMLDLGAGDGRLDINCDGNQSFNIRYCNRPTEAMSGFYQQVFATEVSSPMRKHLALKGFQVLDIDKWSKAGVVSWSPRPHIFILGL